MADHVTIKLDGFKELAEELRALGARVEANGLRSANYAGAMVITRAAKATAPVKTGLLRASIRAFRRRGPPFSVTHSVGVRGIKLTHGNTALNRRLRRVGKKYQADGPAFYGKFIEFGTSKMAAKPFLRPAFLANVDNAVNGIKGGLVKAIARATAKARRV